MAGSTTNLNLVKPLGTEQALVSVINGNMDIIDNKMGSIPSDKNLQGQINTLSDQIGILDGSTPYAEGNANSYTTTGIYHVGITQNSPTGNAIYGDLFVQGTGQRVTQMFTIFDGTTYVRQRSSATTWNAWQQFATVDQIEKYHTWTRVLEITTTANESYDVDSSVTYPTYGISEIMFTLQRASNGRTFASTIIPFQQFNGGAIYTSGMYQLYSGIVSSASTQRIINAVAIRSDSSHIKIAMNANDEAIKARVFVR